MNARRAILLGPLLLSTRGLGRYARELLNSLEVMADDLKIGVDGGTEVWLRAGINPDLAVGDWDSLKKREILRRLPRPSRRTHPTEKDDSDLFLAAQAAVMAGARELICAGVSGGRPDHQLAMLYDLSRIARGEVGSVRRVEAWGADARYIFLSSKLPEWKDKLPLGKTISVFAVGGVARGVTLEGFRFPLREGVLPCSSLGLSNVVARQDVRVRVKSGSLVVMIT